MADELSIDLSNYKDRVGSRVAPGRYTVVVDDVELDKSSAGNDMINVWFRVQGGEFDGATIIDRLTQTEKALFRTVGFMQGLGLPTPKKRLRVNIRQWVGRTLQIDVEDGEPYNGRVKSEVRGYLRVAKDQQMATSGGDDLEGLEEFASEPDEEATTAAAQPSAAAEPEQPTLSDDSDDADVDLETVDLR